jgi:trehalose 6-phosphate synthase/phosphatase
MPIDERRARMRPMRARVMTFDAAAWAKTFIDDLNRVETAVRETGRTEEAVRQIRAALAAGKRVGLFLDYDGTLREIEREPQAAFPNAAVRDLLARLRGHEGLDVTIISGRKPADLEAWLGGYGFGLIAEHGAEIRRPGSAEWEQLDRSVSYAWKEPIARVLQLHEQSTPGSFLEDKRTSLVWHYRKADPEFGEWKAKQVAEELASLIANDPLEVRHGKKIVEVTSTEVNKGAAVRRIVDEVGGYDMIVVAGDDVTDESMFRLDLPDMISIKVGWEETHAQYRVGSPAEFRRLLAAAVTAPATPESRPSSPSAVGPRSGAPSS